jgi:hypothetical protein
MEPNSSNSSNGGILDQLSQLARNIQIKQYNRKSSGGDFSQLDIASVWGKAQGIHGYDLSLWRQDACGAPIYRLNYGKTVDTGWEIDHIIPIAHNGTDALTNLQPLQWRNNRYKGDKLDQLYCVVPGKRL